MRRSVLLLASIALLAASGSADAVTCLSRRLRAPCEWDALRDALLAAKPQAGTLARHLDKAADYADYAAPTLEYDLADVISVNALVMRAINHPSQRPQAMNDAFDALLASLTQFTNGTLQDFQDEIDTFLAANPGKNVSRQQKALANAQGLVTKAAQQTSPAKNALFLRKAVLKVRKANLFPYVAKPPKGKCPGKLQKGEIAQGPWAVVDFRQQSIEPYWFQANWGYAKVTKDAQGNPTFLKIEFGYCDGIDSHITAFQATLRDPTLGTFGLGDNVGGFQHGPGFVLTMTGGSTITIDTLDYQSGIVAGSYQFTVNANAGGGTGVFVMSIDP